MLHTTNTRKQALREAREILLAAKRNGGKKLQGAWEYLRDEMEVATPAEIAEDDQLRRGIELMKQFPAMSYSEYVAAMEGGR